MQILGDLMVATDVRTAIFPVAGLGTRMLPATKSLPKELLPIIDRPLIQFAIDEARAAGVERMVFVSHPSKAAIEHYVSLDTDLIETLRARGKTRLARMLEQDALDPDETEVVFTMQEEPLGLGHAVACARRHALPGPVAVLLPDDLILGAEGCLSEMVAAYRRAGGGHMVATMPVPRRDVSKYGVLSVSARDGRLLRADGMVEKPAPEAAPSTEAVVGRYILDASIFDDLARQTPGAGGEIQLTDAIAAGIGRVGLHGLRLSGERFDCGSKAGLLRATLALAENDPEYRSVLDEFRGPPMLTAAE
jgi:UTP-glucose-1-phosphate uridylyltransferase